MAGCACDPFTFHITPSGPGNNNEVPAPGTFTNPSFAGSSPWGGSASTGCLLAGELNSTWIAFTVATTDVLQFSFGANGQQVGFYDWAMWPYTGASTCTAVAANGLAPVRCVRNATASGGTGLASPPPPGGNPGNYAPMLNVVAGQQFIVCLSNWSFVNADVTLDFFGTATIQCGPMLLPVELISFSVRDDRTSVHTQWITGNEHDNDHFEVQRSADGEYWSSVGWIRGATNSQVPLHYAWDDQAPLNGWSYYRLRQVDGDGSAHYSNVEVVHHVRSEELRAWPQPCNGEFQVTGLANEPVLMDAIGRSVPVHCIPMDDAVTWRVMVLKPATGLYTLLDPIQEGRSIRVAIDGD